MDNQPLYDQDFYAWANEQAQLLRAGRLSEADIENIAEEIASLGRSEKRELISRLTLVLLHLLKWQHQSVLRSTSWRLTLEEQRNKLEDHLADNPSLKSSVPQAIGTAYRDAVLGAARETSLERTTFPVVCPWSVNEILDPNFFPDPNSFPEDKSNTNGTS
jgi:hypothetical protein